MLTLCRGSVDVLPMQREVGAAPWRGISGPAVTGGDLVFDALFF